MDELPEPWASWSAARPEPRVVHLDTAAGRSSVAVLDAVAAHARLELESESGAYGSPSESPLASQ